MERLLTPEEAAALLRVSVYTVKEYARKSIIPALKVGGVWRFSESSILKYLNRHYPELGNEGSQSPRVRDTAINLVCQKNNFGVLPKYDIYAKRRIAADTLDEIRLRTKPGSVVALIRESRRSLGEPRERQYSPGTQGESK